MAMNKIGKNKAPSVDGIMDLIFKREEWNKIKLHNWRSDDKEHRKNIENELAEKMAMYFNHIMEEKDELPYKQNLLE